MTTPTFPDPVKAYFAAETQSPEHVSRCFTAQGIVRDEGHTHTGRDAIEAWKARASAKYNYTNEPFALETVDDLYVVRSHVAGNFPGSPVDLKYSFRLERGLIAELEIGA